MSGRSVGASLLDRARQAKDPLAARLWLAASVTEVGLRHGVRVVVTGGTAVDFYVAGALGTSPGWPHAWQGSADVDVVALATDASVDARRELFHALERELGLLPAYDDILCAVEVPDFPFGVEIVGDSLTHDPTAARVATVRLDDKYPITLRGPEDLVLAYLEGAVTTRHRGDWARVLAILSAQADRIDMEQLRGAAGRLGLGKMLEEAIAGRPLKGPGQ